jgi:hypothetical protein
MLRHRHYILVFGRMLWLQRAIILALFITATAAHAQFNDWINPFSGNWDVVTNWSAGLPNSSQFEVRIINTNSKAVAIQPSTPVDFPSSMTVQNLRVGGVPPNTNVLLLNYSGTRPSLRVLNDLNIESNGRVLMLHSGLNVGNAVNVNGVLDQEAGELTFTNSYTNTMQIEGGHFNLTNGLVTGVNMYLGGTSDGFVNQDSGLVSLAWLILGWKPSFPNTNRGTYVLQTGWLIVSDFEGVGQTGFGTLIQNGGTNSASDLFVGNGTYVKNGGGLFAGEVRLIAPSEPIFAPPTAILTHAGGTAMITNDLRLGGQGSRLNPRTATFNMFGGSLSAHRILLEQAGMFIQTNGTVYVANELFVDDNGGRVPSNYYLSGGNLFTSDTTLSSSYPESSNIDQSGGRHIVTNTLWINGNAIYQLSGGTVTASNIVLTGNLNNPPQFFVYNAPPFAVTNETISLLGGAIVIENSTQQFGRLTIKGDSGINLAGNSAVLSFADSHTNSWQGELPASPQITVFNWNGSTNGGGTDQLIFGASSSALTASQLTQIRFVNPDGFSSGTYPSRILSTGEVVPMPLPGLSLQNNGTNLVINWPGNFTLQSATNVVGPYFDVTNATSPYSLDVHQFPMQFFRLRD